MQHKVLPLLGNQGENKKRYHKCRIALASCGTRQYASVEAGAPRYSLYRGRRYRSDPSKYLRVSINIPRYSRYVSAYWDSTDKEHPHTKRGATSTDPRPRTTPHCPHTSARNGSQHQRQHQYMSFSETHSLIDSEAAHHTGQAPQTHHH